MAIANFEEMLKGYCDIAGLMPCELAPDANGALSFTLNVRGVAIVVAKFDATPGHEISIIVQIGPVAPEHEDVVLPLLLNTNFASLGANLPSFSRNPANGAILLRTFWSLAGSATVVELLQLVQGLADAALDWRHVFEHGRSEHPLGFGKPDGMAPSSFA